MKTKLLLALTAASLAVPVHARTWTSADGSKTFDGEYVTSTDTTVTVTIRGHQRTFKLDLLSADDKKWITTEKQRLEKETKQTPAQGSLSDQKIGQKLIGNTVRLVKSTFVRQDTQKVPDYYLLYFSASW